MLAAKTMMQYAIDHEAEIYPRLAKLGEKARRTMASAFIEEGIHAHCTGYGNDVVPGSSMAHLHFPYREDARMDRPEQLFDPAVCDVELSKNVLQLALLLEDVYLVHGHGAVAAAHTDADLSVLESACRRAAHRIKSSL
jgi:glutamate-1-semialdehyde aminotransferase